MTDWGVAVKALLIAGQIIAKIDPREHLADLRIAARNFETYTFDAKGQS
jgi:hypothetical protein